MSKQHFMFAGNARDSSAHTAFRQQQQQQQFAGSSNSSLQAAATAVCRQQQQQQFGLAVQDVHFGYTGEREVVGGVSLSVEPGQSIALVGPSGSGKSTILKLLMRLYDVNSGSILLDGIDTRDLQQVSLHFSCDFICWCMLLEWPAC